LKIILVRHGRPVFDHRGWIAPQDMAARIAAYKEAGIQISAGADAKVDGEGRAYGAAGVTARDAGCIVASDLPRSVQSARALANGREVLCESLFREADMPHGMWGWPLLPYRLWCAVFRVAWLCGFSGQAESRADAEARARDGSQRLMELARERGSVLLVGHGVINRLIARALLARGAMGPRRLANGYWSMDVYEFAVT
jgi:broad specificity phosphatase PhoE